jgi:hypothetical protein
LDQGKLPPVMAARSVRVLFAELQPDSERSPSRRSLGPAEFQLNRESELYLLSGAAALAVVALESDQIPFHRAPAAPSRSRSSRYSTPNRAWHRQLQVGAAAIPLQPSTARRSRALSLRYCPVSVHRSSESEIPTQAPIFYPPSTAQPTIHHFISSPTSHSTNPRDWPGLMTRTSWSPSR